MEESNYDLLRLLLTSLHRQSDGKTIISDLIYEFMVKCECEIDFEQDETKDLTILNNPWF